VLSHNETVKKFVELDRCGLEHKKEHIGDDAGDGTTVDIQLYSGCAGGNEVRSYVVNGGGHTWPSGMQYLPAAMIGKTTHNLNGSEVIWKFFSQHRR
jgi:polyhydroxybutyrate depolymerase